MREILGLAHEGVSLLALLVFFIVALTRALSLWNVVMPEDTRLLRRIEATSYFVASQVIMIYLRIKWKL